MQRRSEQDSEAYFVEDIEVNLFRTSTILFPILADVICYFLLAQLHQLRNESKHTGEYILFL